MSASLLIEAAAARAEVQDGQWTRRLGKAMVVDQTVRAFRAVFLNAEGEFTPDAEIVLAYLADQSRLGLASPRGASGDELRERAAEQRVLLEIISKLDLSGRALRKAAATLRENGQ